MDNALVVKTSQEPPVRFNPGLPTEHEMMVYSTVAKQAVASKMYRGIGDEAGVMMIMLSARELGIPSMQALNGGLNIINGKVEISARMMNALIRRAGHHINILESTETLCKLKGRRGDTGDTAEVSYSIAEAQKAKLVKPGGGWEKNPTDMCFARALSRLARQLFSDVIGIGYVEGEIAQADVEVVSKPVAPTEIHFVDKEEDKLQQYLALFVPEEHDKAKEYLQVVKDHFEWSSLRALTELLKDEAKLLDKFNTWKKK